MRNAVRVETNNAQELSLMEMSADEQKQRVRFTRDEIPRLRDLEGVADSLDRADQLAAQLASQCLDVTVNGAAACDVTPTPELGEQDLPGDGSPWTGGQISQQVELRAGQVHFYGVTTDSPLGEVELDVAEDHHRRRRGLLGHTIITTE